MERAYLRRLAQKRMPSCLIIYPHIGTPGILILIFCLAMFSEEVRSRNAVNCQYLYHTHRRSRYQFNLTPAKITLTRDEGHDRSELQDTPLPPSALEATVLPGKGAEDRDCRTSAYRFADFDPSCPWLPIEIEG
jgi:hypothetical protein